MRRALAFLAVTTIAAACGGAGQQDLGPAGGSSSSSGGSTSSGGSSSSGGSGDSGSDARGGSSSGSGDSGLRSDAPINGVITTQITITDLLENCQPVVQADPIELKGSITITNGTASSIGPITFPGGAFLLPQTQTVLATFKLKPVTMSALGSGVSETVAIEKQQNSSDPSNACNTLPCGSEVIVEVTASGPGVPANARIRTDPIKVGCAL
jgi:hypothetical protein